MNTRYNVRLSFRDGFAAAQFIRLVAMAPNNTIDERYLTYSFMNTNDAFEFLALVTLLSVRYNDIAFFVTQEGQHDFRCKMWHLD